MVLPYKRYADFSGRSCRREYFMFAVFQCNCLLLILAISQFGRFMESVATILFFSFILVSIIPGIAIQVRRLHDQNQSGWFCLLMLLPLAVFIIAPLLLFLGGTRGDNLYGPAPKQ
jgi:uncharacterized membrane protein YhaH (DUF805 family)